MDQYTENLILSSGKFEEEKQYWLEKLSGDCTFAGFPADYARDGQQWYKRDTLSALLPQTLAKSLDHMANGSDYGLYLILLCGIYYLIHRFDGSHDMVIGMPPLAKDQKEGMESSDFSALRNKMEGGWRFKDLLMDLKKNVDDARKYCHIPLKKIVEITGLKLQDDALPSFKTIALLSNIQDTTLVESTQVDVVFVFHKAEDNLQLELIYNARLYKSSTMERVFAYLESFYSQITQDTGIKLADLDVLCEREKQLVLHDFNNTAVEYPKDLLIHQLFEDRTAKHPDRVALAAKDSTMTYGGLNEKANQIARKLREAGVRVDSVVGILVDRSFDMMIAILSVLKAGGAYLPIDPEYPTERIRFMLSDCGVSIMLTQRKLTRFIQFDREMIYLDDASLYQGDSSNLEAINHAGSLAYVVYTSGSTGEPKGAMIAHRSVHNFIIGMTQKIDFSGMKTIICLTTICFDIFVLETLLPLSQGLKIVIADENEQKDPRLLNEIIIGHQVDMMQVTPSRLQLYIGFGDKFTCLERVSTIMVGGEAFPHELLVELRKITRAKIYNMYGPIETTVWSCVKELEGVEEITIGMPIANTAVYILGSNNRLMPVGMKGELCIAGDGLSRGYINRPQLTLDKFTVLPFAKGENPAVPDLLYHTGDSAIWLADGNLKFLGRMDYQVKIRGFRIEPGEIEARLLTHEAVKEAAVIDKRDKDGSTYLYAYVVLKEEINFSKIKDYLAEVLPYYMVPSYYKKLQRIPQTFNGKIDRRALRNLEDEEDVRSSYAAPQTELERKIVEIWQDVLKVDKIGIDDDIEALGGNSFIAMKLELAMEMNDLEITNIEVFQNRTIRRLGAYIQKKQNG